MQRLHVFVDEYGDAQLEIDKPGVSETYIVAAVCVWDTEVSRVKTEAEIQRRKTFQTGELKSSAIGSNVGRRIDVLRKLSRLDAFVIAFCARKGELSQDSGLNYKKSFIKFFARKMYERLARYSDDMVVIADKHGSPEFQDEFRRYLEDHVPSDLFRKASFDFCDSRDEVMLQVADVFAGSLARLYEPSKTSERLSEMASVMRDRISITLWPTGAEPAYLHAPLGTAFDDERIRRYCIGQAEGYLNTNRALDDKDEAARVAFLEALLSNHAWGADGEYVPTSVLLREIRRRIGEPLSEHKLRSSVVARLRDQEIIIASCSKGYKIPSSCADMREFALFANSIAPPMISRLEKARRGVREATMGEVDILSGSDLQHLRNLVEAIREL